MNHKHFPRDNNCPICFFVESVIRPILDFETRKTIVKDLESLLCNSPSGRCWGVNQEHCDTIQECINVIRSKNGN